MAPRRWKRPAGRSCRSTFRGHGSSMGVTPTTAHRVTLGISMPSVASPYRSPSARPRAEPYAQVGIAVAAFAVSIAFMRHGGFFVSQAGSGELGAVGVILVAFTTLPLLAWRRSPFGVFVATATANVLLAAFVYPIGLPLGPAVALYLVAAGR